MCRVRRPWWIFRLSCFQRREKFKGQQIRGFVKSALARAILRFGGSRGACLLRQQYGPIADLYYLRVNKLKKITCFPILFLSGIKIDRIGTL